MLFFFIKASVRDITNKDYNNTILFDISRILNIYLIFNHQFYKILDNIIENYDITNPHACVRNTIF